RRLQILNMKRLERVAQLGSRTTKSTTNLRGSPSGSGPNVGPAQFDSATAKLVATLQIVRLCSVNSGSSVRVRSVSLTLLLCSICRWYMFSGLVNMSVREQLQGDYGAVLF